MNEKAVPLVDTVRVCETLEFCISWHYSTLPALCLPACLNRRSHTSFMPSLFGTNCSPHGETPAFLRYRYCPRKRWGLWFPKSAQRPELAGNLIKPLSQNTF